MAAKLQDTVILTTPHGHEVVADFDYENFEVHNAKVVHGFTGVMKPLDQEVTENLARALRAKQVYEQALSETKQVELTLERFGDAAVKLGKKHPALAPYWQEVEQHRAIASDMCDRAKHFHDDAMEQIDKLVEE